MNDLPQFASIQTIVVMASNKIYFMLKTFVTIAFVSHFRAYEVRRLADCTSILLEQNKLPMCFPTHTTNPSACSSINGVLHVAPRYIPSHN